MFIYKFARHLAIFTRGNGGTFPVKGMMLVDFRWRDYKYKRKPIITRDAKETIMICSFSSTIDKK